MDIVIIGSGNVATVMGRKMNSAGHRVVQVAGRSAAGTHKLASLLEASFTTDFSQLKREADLYFIAIPDDALMTAGKWLRTGNALTVHTAGSVSIDALKDISSCYGVVYPLQSLRSDVTTIPEIPLLVDGHSPETQQAICSFARSLSPTVVMADDGYRKKIHLAAVISGNFSNHLFALTDAYCRQESLDFSLILPLLKESIDRLENHPADSMQTGPALRNDMGTIENHLRMLDGYPALKNLYTLLTDSIRAFYKK